jgi:N-acetylneuraminic acid mutarotase
MKKQRSEPSATAWTLAKAVHDLKCPAREVISNPWLFQDIMKLAFEKPKIEFIMASGGMSGKPTEIYSISTNSWRYGPDLPQDRFNHGIALVNVDHSSHREIFIIGGLVDRMASSSVVSLVVPTTSEIDPAMQWKEMPNLNVKRYSHGVGVVNGKKIFVIGGRNESGCSKSIEVFSVNEGKWIDSSSDDVYSQVPPDMSIARCGMGVAVIGKRIFVIGGYNGTDGHLSSVEVLDTETNKWSTLPSMKTARWGMGITVIDDRFIWIFGGWTLGRALDSIEIFDAEKNEWLTPSIKLTPPRFGMSAIAVDHKIFIIGGTSQGFINLALVQLLDVDEMKWTTPSPPNLYHRHHSAVGF